MEYICLFLAMTASALLSIMSSAFGRYANTKKSTSFLYSVVVTFSAFAVWGIICFSQEGINLKVLGYSLAYGIFYTVAMIGMFKAYQTGSVSLTAFVKQLSLIAVAFWGFVFWKNPLTTNILSGIVLIIIALYLCFKPENGSKNTIVSIKWVIFAIMLLVGNAGCSIIQKYQQMAFDGNYGSALMFLATGVAFIISLILYLKNDGLKFKEIKKPLLIYPAIGGISSGLLNLLILVLISSPLSESIIFPCIAVGGLIITMIFSLIVYKEKLTPVQWCGFLIGIIAIVLLNL